ncbi:hypothetical protein C8R45DRAFT_979005 [Mycena sanguinolenta]|nr:hypothetical protein C8R45DRAFT_979005 [Mycena sanguinolenta]
MRTTSFMFIGIALLSAAAGVLGECISTGTAVVRRFWPIAYCCNAQPIQNAWAEVSRLATLIAVSYLRIKARSLAKTVAVRL